MSEASGKEDQVKDPSRRRFLNRVGKVAIGVAGSVALGGTVGNEINKSENGIVTESGILFPLYERHDKGIDVESIPDNLDVFLRETGILDAFSPSPEQVLRYRFIYPNIDIPAFPDKVLASFSQSKTEIMMGDAKTPGLPKIDVMIMGSEIIGGSALLGKLLTGQSKNDSRVGFGRRKFLQAVMLSGAAWGLSKVPGAAGVFLEPYNRNAIDKIYSRLSAIESHMHPELSLIFFRNLVMADKLLTVSEDIGKKTGQKAKIAFQVGASLTGSHAGIEDFLQAGHDFCRGLILAYPKQYLRSTVGLNNGVREFSSARLFRMPENLTAEDIVSGERLKETTERRVVDETLEKALTLKLA